MASNQEQLPLWQAIAAKPLDKGGSVGSNRYDFQKSWTLCLMLDLHQSGLNYVVVFEHHDDALVLDEVLAPTTVSFYQVKTENKNWTQARLLARPKGKTGPLRSVLGRMVWNGARFAPSTKSLELVSTTPFNVTVDNHPPAVDRSKIKFSELGASAKKAILESLEKELESKAPFGCEDSLVLVVTDVPVQTHEVHTRGRLSQFLETIGLHDAREGPLHRAIMAELQRRSNREAAPEDYSELLRTKSISREQFTAMLGASGPRHRVGEAWAVLSPFLLREGLKLSDSRTLEQAVRRYEIDSLDPGNMAHLTFRSTVKDAVASVATPDSMPVLAMTAMLAETITPPPGRDASYVRAAVLFEAYGYFDELQEADSKSAKAGI